jgi:hypothetical protein
MPIKKRVFIFGSGISVQAGFPLAIDFIPRIREYLNISNNCIDLDFKDDFNQFITHIDNSAPLLIRDIELFFTYLDLFNQDIRIDLYNELFLTIDNLIAFRKRLSGALLGLFGKIHSDLYSKTDPKIRKTLMEPYNLFCLGLSTDFQDTIITFNYDLLLEQELWVQGKWTFLDGYGIDKKVCNFEDDDHAYPDNKPRQSTVKIYKLHGSIGWIRSYPGNTGIYFEIDRNAFPGYTGKYFEKDDYLNTEAMSHDRGTTLIDPSYLKTFENENIKMLWQKADVAIQECDELFIIGYSFPMADLSAQQLMAGAVRKSMASKIVIVNPDDAVKNKAEIVLGRKILFVSNTFEGWLRLNKVNYGKI